MPKGNVSNSNVEGEHNGKEIDREGMGKLLLVEGVGKKVVQLRAQGVEHHVQG
tara:strand:+ start:151 stop:309 length:159 start_codon:yes stop_codon:yes gene_type:complete